MMIHVWNVHIWNVSVIYRNVDWQHFILATVWPHHRGLWSLAGHENGLTHFSKRIYSVNRTVVKNKQTFGSGQKCCRPSFSFLVVVVRIVSLYDVWLRNTAICPTEDNSMNMQTCKPMTFQSSVCLTSWTRVVLIQWYIPGDRVDIFGIEVHNLPKSLMNVSTGPTQFRWLVLYWWWLIREAMLHRSGFCSLDSGRRSVACTQELLTDVTGIYPKFTSLALSLLMTRRLKLPHNYLQWL